MHGILWNPQIKGKRFYGCENYPKCKHVQWALNMPVSNLKTQIANVKSASKIVNILLI